MIKFENGRQKIDEAVIKAIKDGNMSTLNCPEEVLMAEKLLSVHPWSKKARFARSGGEACSIAIRIARAFTNKKNIKTRKVQIWSSV